MQLGLVAAGEEAGRFEHDFDAKILPRKITRIAFLQEPDLVATHDDVFGIVTNLAIEFAVNRVPFEQVRDGSCVREIVDGGDAFDVALFHRAQDVASDSAEAVDSVIGHRKRWLS